MIAATGLCGRDVGWGCDRLIAAAGLCGMDVGWGCDRLIAAAGLCGMDVGWGCDRSHQTPKKDMLYILLAGPVMECAFARCHLVLPFCPDSMTS